MTTHKENLSELSLAQLETITGAAYKTIKRRIGGLQPVRTDGKTLYFDPVVALRLIYEVGADADSGVNPLDTERARLAKHQADRAEMEVEAMRGNLVPIAEISAAWTDLLSAFRAKILSLPTKIAPMLAGVEAVAQIQSIIRDGLDETLTELAGYEPKQSDLAAAEKGAGKGGAPAKADRQPVGGQREDAEQ